jgi:hypothetical protein
MLLPTPPTDERRKIDRSIDRSIDPSKVVQSGRRIRSVPHPHPPTHNHPPTLTHSDPVTTCDGHSYDRSAIQAWLARGHKTSPMTGVDLPTRRLYPNRALQQLAAHLRPRVMEEEEEEEVRGSGGGGGRRGGWIRRGWWW